MKKSIFYLDGKYLEAAKELLETFTPGQNNYRGVFETIFVLDKKAVYLQEHLERLQEGLRVLKIKHSFTTFKLKYVVSQVIIKNPFIKPGRLRLMVFPQDKTIHCACMIVPYKAHNKKQYQEGLSAYVIKTNRPANSLNANVKSLDYAFFANALKSANEHDCDEAILMNRKGHVFETSRGNIFLFISLVHNTNI